MNLHTGVELSEEVLNRMATEGDNIVLSHRQNRISEEQRALLWGEATDELIEATIIDIENRVELWRDIYGMVFLFVHTNTGFQCSVFWANSQRATVAGDNPKSGLSLINGTVVGSGLIGYVKAAKRGPLKSTLFCAYSAALDMLERIEDFRRENTEDDLDGFLTVSPSRSLILPEETFDKVLEIVNDEKLSTHEIENKVWTALRSQMRLSKSLNKKRVLEVVIPALQRSNIRSISLTTFMESLTQVQKDLREVVLPNMTRQIAALMATLDKSVYSYVEVAEGIKVPVQSRQALSEGGKEARSQVVKRSKMVVVEYFPGDSVDE